MARVLDEADRKAVAAAVRYYRDLGIYDLYRRESPESAALVRQELARGEGEEATSGAAASTAAPPDAAANFTSEPTSQTPMFAEPVSASADAAKLAEILRDKPAALRVIREEIGDCKRCRLCKERTNIVFGVGDPETRIMFVGEGPGADEDAQGEPFVGRAGQLLNNMIQAMGLSREQVYIANVVKCRPPKNRTPERDECETCGPFLMRQISVVRPQMIVALGATAAKFLLGVSDAMARLRGRVYEFHPIVPAGAPERDPSFTTSLVVTYHPAFLLRDPRQKKEAWADLQLAMKTLGMSVPRRSSES
jgi:uracil-DNA glycosylase family 4